MINYILKFKNNNLNVSINLTAEQTKLINMIMEKKEVVYEFNFDLGKYKMRDGEDINIKEALMLEEIGVFERIGNLAPCFTLNRFWDNLLIKLKENKE